MPSIQSILKRGTLSLTALLLSISSVAPLAAFAECTPPSSDQPGIHQPVGSDAATYVYQCDGPYAGQWLNDHYVYNPADGSVTPTYGPDYQYNCTTGKWTKSDWVYAPAQGTFTYYRTVISAPNGIATNCNVAAASGAGPSGSISNTGPNSNNGINNNGTSNTGINNNTGANITNSLNATANSGNAVVLGNTIAGGATSGDTQDIANVINLLQSSSNALGSGNVVSFVTNIDGDVNGDFLLDPSSINSVQNTGPNSTNAANTNLSDNLTVNNSVNATIDNTINLDANSGNATVANNTNGGDAKTGSAKAVANVVNMINSALTAGKSFLGVININGNLNGDILLPADFVDQLVAANVPTVTISTTGPSSNNTSNNNVTDNTKVTNTNNQGITNNVNANASSGSAGVTNNTNGGNATTGTAKTSVTAFNLTGSNVIGTNDILVFVNVVGGKWVGLIVNAPAGSTAASLGSHISTTGPGSNNSTNNNSTSNTNINNTANQKINNNITTNAHSGNANVNGNTTGGNATSGDAESAVNLLNVENSTFDLSGWFGILFINVFGTWNGSFGINTSAGDPIASGAGSAFANAGSLTSPAQVVSFVQTHGGGHGFDFTPFTSANFTGNGSNDVNGVLAASKSKNALAPTPQLQDAHSSFRRTAIVIGSLVVLFIVADAYHTRRQARNTQL